VLGLFSIQTLSSPLVGELDSVLTTPVAWLLVIGTFYLLPGRGDVPVLGDAGELAAVPREPAGRR